MNLFVSIALAAIVFGVSAGVVKLYFGSIEISWLMLLLTLLSVVLSFVPRVRDLKMAFPVGEYLLLVFCVAIGMLSDFMTIYENSLTLLSFNMLFALVAISLHYLLAAIFKIDTDTVLITSTAAVFGPIFIGQVASAINNKSLIFSGMLTGLVGYAIGNFLGIGMGQFLNWLSAF